MAEDTATKKHRTGKCCQCCKDGTLTPRWQNVTKVRSSDGGDPPTISEIGPFPRQDTGFWNSENPGAGCSTQPPGFCGTWLAGGDLNGVSEQEVEDMVDDILACAGADATHYTYDHNCYFQNGDTVNTISTHRAGAQWVLAKKFWHGRDALDFITNPADDAENEPNQTRYLGYGVSATFTQNLTETRYAIFYDADNNVIEEVRSDTTYSGTLEQHNSGTVDRYTGIKKRGSKGSTDTLHLNYQIYDSVNTPTDEGSYEEDTPDSAPMNLGTFGTYANWLTEWSYDEATETFGFFRVSGVPVFSGTAAEIADQVAATAPAGWIWAVTQLSVSETALVFEITISPGAVDPTPGFTNPSADHASGYISTSGTATYKLEVALSIPYSATEVMDDLRTMHAEWDLSDLALAPFRTDEQLANAPLILMDEVGASLPELVPDTMDDYSADKNEDGTWPQRDWIDPSDYLWKFDDSLTMPAGFTGGATLVTPLRVKTIIAHNQAGSDRHFWFGYPNMIREATPESGIDPYEWFMDTHGGYSVAPLPSCSVRWMDKFEAQWDGLGRSMTPGNFPQSFIKEYGGFAVMGKYVEAVSQWPSVNYARPCGLDKFAVDNPSVCAILSGDATSGFTVRKTGNATAPLDTGGLQDDDYIITGTEIRRITGIVDNGDDTFDITVGALLETSPVGIGSEYIGRLRWPTAPGICGRIAITTSYDSGTGLVTISCSAPYLRKDPTTGTILVDLYDADMASLVASASVTRVDDNHFTFTHAAIPTAVWMTGAGVDWTKNDSSPKRTAVHLEWGFYPRLASRAAPPAFYADVAGCTSASITQFNYEAAKCRSVVGIVPFYSAALGLGGDSLPTGDTPLPDTAPLEDFTNQVLFPMPTTMVFDSVYGAHWQGAVEVTMPDPFWQAPFKPDAGIEAPDSLLWKEDNGSGQADTEEETEGGAIIYTKYFAHRPLVEAATTVPAGMSLPSGVSLYYDTSVADIAPPYYPNGIPIGDVNGNYASVERPYAFAARACAASRFTAEYAYITCPP